MNRSEIEAIVKECLNKWARHLVAEHGTPMILLGIGHDHKSGEAIVCMPHNGLTTAQVVAFLRQTIVLLEAGAVEERHHDGG